MDSIRTSAHPRDYWWKAPQGNCHAEMFSACEHLRNQQEYRKAAYVHYLRLYSNRLASDLTGEDFAASVDGGDRIRLNVVKSAIDTAVAMISTDRAKAQYMSIGGTFMTRKRAERQTKWVLGALLKLKHYTLSQDIFRDGCIFGTGIEWADYYEDDIFLRRVFPDELVVDDADGRIGPPVQAFLQYNVDKHWFVEYWPDDADAILSGDCVDEIVSSREGLTDPVTVTIGWKPAPYTGGAGRYAIAVSGKTLLDEDYDSTSYPWELWRWNTSPLGWLGMGAAEELQSIQTEINWVAQKIQKLMTLATSMVWTQRGSGVRAITNADWARYEYNGRPPIFQNVTSVSAEYFTHLDRLYTRAYELMGISQLTAGAVKPLGIDSGEGLRTYHDITAKRFLHTGQRWAQYHVDISEQVLDRARCMAEEGHNPTVLYPGHRDAEEIDFKKAVLEKDRYLVRVQPASLLPDDPAGRVEMLGKLAQSYPELAGHLQGLLATVPDLEFAVSLVRAPFEITEKHINSILENGRIVAPHPMMDLGVARLIAQRYYALAELQGIGEDRMELLRRYISKIDDLQAQQAMNAMAPPALPPVPPEGMQTKPTPPMAQLQPGSMQPQ